MALAPGTRLGVFTLIQEIGRGGMGEVYRARDTKLDRDVAIKVLPEAFAHDAERLARFLREAKTLASLNHPNIAAIYGIEESGGITALVMELVEGDDLSQRIAAPGPRDAARDAARDRAGSATAGSSPPRDPAYVRGEGAYVGRVSRSRPAEDAGLPIDEALAIAKQIADALEAAHELGIIHRDCKPANIKVRPDGVVKVLDFGLAKAMEPTGVMAVSHSMAPTITTPALMTGAGMILGTAAYMSPEQARGRTVDKRADIWAFGVVLFEMLTGQRAFGGEDIAETLANVINKEPAWEALPTTVPAHVRQTLRLCLRKQLRERVPDIGAVRLALEGAFETAAQPTTGMASQPAPASMRRWLWAVAAALVLMTAASVAFALWSRPADVEKASTRLTIPLPPGQEIATYPAITRDGQTVAYVTQQGLDAPQLYLRDLNSFEARAVAGASGAMQPFFSPDGTWVAFFAQGQLQKAEVTGGAPIRLAEAAYPFGGTWNDDNTIIYTASINSGLLRIPASGGTPESLTKPDGAANGYAHVFPQALPGGRSLLFTLWGQTQGNAVLSLDSRRWEIVLPATSFGFGFFDPERGSEGRILVVDQSAGIMAAPFDAAHPARTSADTTVLSNVYWELELESRGWLSISNNRTAVYAAGNPTKTSLVWVDREGKAESLGKGQDLYRDVRLSPDGMEAVVRIGGNLWIHDLQRGTRAPLTSGNASNFRILWSPDGTRIIFGSNRGGDWDIYSQPSDGSRPAEVLLKRPDDQWPLSMSRDGTLLYREINAKTAIDLWTDDAFAGDAI
jgi:serine/threonine-protein kinase